MKFKVFNEDKLTLFGQDAVAILIHELLKKHIAEDFAHSVAQMDYREDLKIDIQFERQYDRDKDFEYILYHMVMFGAALLKYNASDYIKNKLLFRGYVDDPVKAFMFCEGLENGLKHFRQKGNLKNIREIKAETNGNALSCYEGEPLSKIHLPYFHKIFDASLGEVAMEFAKNLAYLRRPKYPNIVIGVFNERATELVPLAHTILHHFFVE